MWAPLVLIAIPIIEIALFITVGSAIGVWSTIGLVLLAAVVGMSILRGNGARSLPAVQAAMQRGEDPGQEIFNATLRMLGGGLLLIPGFFSDIIGLAFLLPPVQAFIYAKAKTRFKAGPAAGFGASFGTGGFQGFGTSGGFGQRPDDDGVIDADFEDVTTADPDKRISGPSRQNHD